MGFFLLMAEFEPESSGVGNDYSADFATTIAHDVAFYYCFFAFRNIL